MLLFPNTNFQLQEVASGTKLGTILFGDIGVEEKRGFKIGDTVVVSTLGKTYEVVATATTNSSLFGAGLPEAVINVTSLARIHIISDTQQAFISEEGGYIILVENVTGDRLNIGAQVYGVKTIDPRYLPQTGGNMIIHITQTEDGSDYIADWTYEEIAEAVQKGIIPVCVFGGRLFYLTLAPVLEEIMPMAGLPYFNFSTLIMNFNYSTYRHESISIHSDNSVKYDMADIEIPK